MLGQIIQIVGSILVLVGFAAAQFGRLKQDSLAYLVLNAAGSGILAVLALQGQQWGFLLLEGTWCVVSVLGLIRRLAQGGSPKRRSRAASPLPTSRRLSTVDCPEPRAGDVDPR